MSVLFDPTSPEFVRDPYPFYARLREQAPVYRHPASFYVVSRHADVAFVLRHPELFSSAAMGGRRPLPEGETRRLIPVGGSLISKDPPVHTEQRRIVSRGFTPRRIAGFESRIREVADAFFEPLLSRGDCDLVKDLANPIPVTVIAELLGLDATRRDDFKRWSTRLVIEGTQAGMMRGPEFAQDMAEFRDYILAVIAHRREHPGDDLVSVLIHAEEQDGILSGEQVFAFVTLLLIAGSETTTNLIGNAMLVLLGRPDVRARVEADPALIPRLVEETLRFDSPVQQVMRMTVSDVELGGGKIPSGSLVFAVLASANRDAAQFDQPDRFDLDRDPVGHLAFGHGHHFCLGASLARLEAQVVLGGVLEQLRRFQRAGEGPLERHGSFLIRGLASLPLHFRS